MSGPIDIVRSIHNAFRRDLCQIDASVLKLVKKREDMTHIFDRLSTVGEILDYHAKGEELAVFPAVENLAPHVSQAYFLDHRELDIMFNNLETIQDEPDPLTTARATAVLQSHLRIHLNKEDSHLYPILTKRTTESEQLSIVRQMSSKVPTEKFPALIQWLLPLLDFDDLVKVTEIWKKMMPPKVFSNIKPLMKKIIAQNWTKLTQQIPNLEANNPK